jgi:hypothetical protein
MIILGPSLARSARASVAAAITGDHSRASPASGGVPGPVPPDGAAPPTAPRRAAGSGPALARGAPYARRSPDRR